MLVIGLVPIASLLWFVRRQGLLHSFEEINLALYFTACFCFFHWSLYLRPEAVLLAVVSLLVLSWTSHHPLLLFLASFFLPFCGFQWNVLLLPVVFHWILFGGSLRKPLCVASGLVVGTTALLAYYHLAGMWPSYLQEAARVGGLDAIHSATKKLHTALSSWDFSWLFTASLAPPNVVDGPLAILVLSGAGLFFDEHSKSREKKLFVFIVLSVISCWGALALFGHILHSYARLLVLPVCLLGPALGRRVFSRNPILLIGFVLCALWIPGVHWQHVKNGYGPWRTLPDDTFWVDEAFTERWIPEIFQPSDVICCDNSAYFALRRTGHELYRLRYALNIDETTCQRISYVLLSEKPPYDPGTDFSQHLGPADNIPSWEIETPSELLSAIATRWHCTFTEIPLPVSPMPNAVRYRLFRPSFSTPSH